MKPEIVYLAEINLCEDIQTNIENNNNCNIWRKNKEGKIKEVVMIMIQSRIKVINEEYRKIEQN